MPLLDVLQNTLDRILPRRFKRTQDQDSGTLVLLLFVPLLWVVWLAMIISKPAVIFHTSQIFFNFLAMACFASVASFQAKWGVGPSGLSGFALFVSISGIFLSAFMMFVPVAYEKYDKLATLAIALKEVRVGFILTGVGSTFSLLIAFVTTISAWTEAGCKNAEDDPHAKISDDFVAGLPSWCSTKKAGCIFFWLAFGFWLASLILLIIDWRSGNLTQRPRDPPFTRPDVEEVEEAEEEEEERRAYRPVGSTAPPPVTITSSSIPPVATCRSTYDNTHSPFDDTNRLSAVSAVTTAAASASTAYPNTAQRNSGYSGYATPPAAVASRPSFDAYGAFSDPAPTGFGGASSSFAPPTISEANEPRISRTMQYADPYAAVRASFTSTSNGPSGAPPSYTSYTGY